MTTTSLKFKPRITVFHCVNALDSYSSLDRGDGVVKTVKMPCSSMLREVFLLRAFEAGADFVVVLACPEGQCRHLDGNIRAAKRVARMKRLVDEIGLDGQRLGFFNVPPGDRAAVEDIISRTVLKLASLGPNPASKSIEGEIQR